ncbi:MAG: S41 family peptidase [Trueperaceae bacterium]|nr:S41 family peptidase [Trueperaceae bacterium]
MNGPGRAACSIGLVAALVWGGAHAQASLGDAARSRYEATILELLGEPSGRAFLEVLRAIEGEYLGAADPAVLLEGALRGLVDALDDPYVRYLDIKDLVTEVAARRDPDVIVTATLGDLGYVRVRSFDSERTGERFGTELDALLVRGVRGLVLDLRGNDGGLVLTGLQVLDRLLPDGVLDYRSSPRGPLSLGFANPRATALPVAVLVDAGTASTAEIVRAPSRRTVARAYTAGSPPARGWGRRASRCRTAVNCAWSPSPGRCRTAAASTVGA